MVVWQGNKWGGGGGGIGSGFFLFISVSCITFLMQSTQPFLVTVPHSIIFNPRRACPARVPVCVCVCVCVSVHGSNLLVAQLCDELVILTGSVSWSLQNKFGVFRIMAKIAIAFPYLRAHCSRPFYTRNGFIFRIPSLYYARDCTRAVNLYAHV